MIHPTLLCNEVYILIVADFSPIVISNFTGSAKELTNPSIDIVRHIVLNTLRSHTAKHKKKYGETVLAIDSTSWRKSVFPHYKAHRAKSRAESDIDWKTIFQYMSQIEKELVEFYPGVVVRVDGAEADDIIAVLTQHFHNQEPMLILSPDKDMQQLTELSGVKQWSTFHKKFLEGSGREVLIEKLMKGDAKDGVPNVRSVDNSFVDKIRQKSVSSKLVQAAYETDDLDALVLEELGSEALRNLHRNRTLIDFAKIPEDVSSRILDKYFEVKAGVSKMRGMKFMNYLVENNMPLLAQSITDF